MQEAGVIKMKYCKKRKEEVRREEEKKKKEAWSLFN